MSLITENLALSSQFFAPSLPTSGILVPAIASRFIQGTLQKLHVIKICAQVSPYHVNILTTGQLAGYLLPQPRFFFQVPSTPALTLQTCLQTYSTKSS